MKFDHIGIVAESLELGRKGLRDCFLIQEWGAEFSDSVNGVYVQFGRDAVGVCYEIIAPLCENSPVQSALYGKCNILNHVAYLVKDLAAEQARLRAVGVRPVAPAKPAVAYGGKRIQFFVSPMCFILELIEAYDHEHSFSLPG
ncbi:MAG TPA: VOC family protein [Terracidiphilus sp.]|jgi:methylmalonyl-CoA/ethylmalonyl-CoA epimerase|nr:VOC family protein [Terracidiphilus sp.]